jgi:hypothetical protein
MFQTTNPPTLKLKLAEDDVSFGSESTSECGNVKKERLGDEAKAGVDVDPSPSTPASSSNEECDNIFCKIYGRNFKHKKSTYSFYGGCPGCVLASRLCDCNNKKNCLCCFIRPTHINMGSPANVKMEIIAKMKKSHESRLSTPCNCFRYDCCWLQTFPDDMKIAISRRMYEMKNLHMGNDSFGLEITSESENVKEKSEDEAKETVFDVKEKRKPEKTGDFIMPDPDEPDIKTMMEKYPYLFDIYLYGKPLKGENGIKLFRLSGYKILEDINDSDEDDIKYRNCLFELLIKFYFDLE